MLFSSDPGEAQEERIVGGPVIEQNASLLKWRGIMIENGMQPVCVALLSRLLVISRIKLDFCAFPIRNLLT